MRKTEYIYETVKKLLVSGEYEFGERLSPIALAEKFETSRQPIMEVMKQLERDHLVEIVPQVGCRVRLPKLRDVADFYEVFGVVEGLITSLAAKRATSDDIAKLKAVTHDLAKDMTAESLTVDRYITINRSFHGAVHEVAASPEIRAAAESYWDRSDFMLASARPPVWLDTASLAYEEHVEILGRIEAGDAPGARALVERHILAFASQAMKSLANL